MDGTRCRRCEAFYRRYPPQSVPRWMRTGGEKKVAHRLGESGWSDPIACGFGADGRFTDENWGCETLLALRRLAEEPPNYRIRYDDLSIAVVPVPGEPIAESGIQGGFVVLLWHKDYGQTEEAEVRWPGENTRHPLELATAEYVLDAAERRGVVPRTLLPTDAATDD